VVEVRRIVAQVEKQLDRRRKQQRPRLVRVIAKALQTLAECDVQSRDLEGLLAEARRRLAATDTPESLAWRDALAARARAWFTATLPAYTGEDIVAARDRRHWFETLLRDGLLTKYPNINVERLLAIVDYFWHTGRYTDDVRLLRECTLDDLERMPAHLAKIANFLDAGRGALADRLNAATVARLEQATLAGADSVLDFVTVLVARAELTDEGDARTRDVRRRAAIARELEWIAVALRAVAGVTWATDWRGARFGGPDGPIMLDPGHPSRYVADLGGAAVHTLATFYQGETEQEHLGHVGELLIVTMPRILRRLRDAFSAHTPA
jgi:hypothetical protein